MERSLLKTFFGTSPVISLFRSPNACYIIDFLHQTFKQGDSEITISHTDLHAALTRYCEDVREVETDSLIGKPEEYIATWSSPDKRWLDRKLGVLGQHEYQLTRHTETVLNFLTHNLDNELGFVGTESRLRMIIKTLTELVEQASDDPEVRLKSLRLKKTEIISEIARLERDDSEVQLSDGQIREQFLLAISLLRYLQSDFRAVEEEFKNITRDVQVKQAKSFHTKGEILGGALDAEDVLRTNDQGVSFYEFFRFILSPSQQEALQETIGQLKEISALKNHTKPMGALNRMVPLLVHEANKIMRTNQRLTTTLRRLLDVRNIQQRQRICELLKEIQSSGMKLAALIVDDELPERLGMSLELKPIIDSPWRYNFWSPAKEFDVPEVSTFHADSGKYVIRDNDKIFSEEFKQTIKQFGLKDTPTTPGSPWQNPIAERVMGTLRRECLNHIIVLSERHLATILTEYIKYYNTSRTHMSLNKDAPVHRPPHTKGNIISKPILGGLHHVYSRVA